MLYFVILLLCVTGVILQDYVKNSFISLGLFVFYSCSLVFYSCSLVFISVLLVFARVLLVFSRVLSCSTRVRSCSLVF